jgi:hypothetical protein
VWGQKVYPVPYAVSRLLLYLLIAVLLGKANEWLSLPNSLPTMVHLFKSTVFLLIFVSLLYTLEREELKKLPLIGKWVR